MYLCIVSMKDFLTFFPYTWYAIVESVNLSEIIILFFFKAGLITFLTCSFLAAKYNKVSVIDTTGAGDNFAAGFLYGLAQNFTLEKCATFGNLIAAEVLKVYGPRIEKSLKDLIVH